MDNGTVGGDYGYYLAAYSAGLVNCRTEWKVAPSERELLAATLGQLHGKIGAPVESKAKVVQKINELLGVEA